MCFFFPRLPPGLSLDDLDKLDSLKQEFSLHLSSALEHPYFPVCLCLEQGAYINGLFMAGARWDDDNMCIEDSFPKARLCTGSESNIFWSDSLLAQPKRLKFHTLRLLRWIMVKMYEIVWMMRWYAMKKELPPCLAFPAFRCSGMKCPQSGWSLPWTYRLVADLLERRTRDDVNLCQNCQHTRTIQSIQRWFTVCYCFDDFVRLSCSTTPWTSCADFWPFFIVLSPLPHRAPRWRSLMTHTTTTSSTMLLSNRRNMEPTTSKFWTSRSK